MEQISKLGISRHLANIYFAKLAYTFIQMLLCYLEEK